LIGDFIVNHYANRLLLPTAEGRSANTLAVSLSTASESDPEKDYSVSAQKSVLGTVMANLSRRYHSFGKDFNMTYRTFVSASLLAFVTACSGLGGTSRFDSETISPAQANDERAQIIERLVPEDTPISRTRLGAVAEATATVIGDTDRDHFPRVASGVRNVLRDASLQDLRRIERILPEIERKRKLEGVD
jgi:hypothetical protein